MLAGFKEFINRGNVIGLAVAVIIGAAFGRVVSSLTDDIIMPAIGWLVGDLDFSNYFVRLGEVPADFKGSLASYADLKAAGVPMLGYGQLATALVNFLIVAFIIYLLVRAITRAIPPKEEAPAADPAEVVLLREIRDELRSRSGG